MQNFLQKSEGVPKDCTLFFQEIIIVMYLVERKLYERRIATSR